MLPERVTAPLTYNGTNWLWSRSTSLVAGPYASSHVLVDRAGTVRQHGQWQIAFTGWTDVGITGAFHPTNTTTNCDPIQIDGNWSDGAGNDAAWTITE